MTLTLVYSKENHKILGNINSNQIKVFENSVIVLNINKELVKVIQRDGHDAIIVFNNGETITIKNYFDFNDNSLVFKDDDEGLFWVKFTDQPGVWLDVIVYQPIEEIEPLLYKDNFAGLILPWVGGGASIGGIVALACSSDSDNKNKSNISEIGHVDPIKPPIAKFLNDTGFSQVDNITHDGTITVTGIIADAVWSYSTDGGANLTTGTGSSFVLNQGTYAADQVQIKQLGTAGNTISSKMSSITITPDLIAKNDLTQTDPNYKVTQDLSNYNGAQTQNLISSNDHGQIDKGKIDHNMYTQGQTAANANDMNYAEVSVKANAFELSRHRSSRFSSTYS